MGVGCLSGGGSGCLNGCGMFKLWVWGWKWGWLLNRGGYLNGVGCLSYGCGCSCGGGVCKRDWVDRCHGSNTRHVQFKSLFFLIIDLQ